MMSRKPSTVSIERVVGKSFLRVVKNHGQYIVVMKMFKRLPLDTIRGERRRGDDGGGNRPSIDIPKSYKYNDFIASLNKFAQSEYSEKGRRSGGSSDRYEYVTILINHLLHNLLEKGGIHPQELGLYGQEIFDLSCFEAYGDEFLNDMDKMRQEHPEMMNRGKLRMQLTQEYSQLVQGGERISFEEFMTKYHRSLIERLQKEDAMMREQHEQHEEFYDDENIEEEYDDEEDDEWQEDPHY